jgi:hypothetical protein
LGLPLDDLSLVDLVCPDTVFLIGVSPFRIDILTSITGVAFDQAWQNKLQITIEGMPVYCIGLKARLINKHTLGRPKDLADIDSLQIREQ